MKHLFITTLTLVLSFIGVTKCSWEDGEKVVLVQTGWDDRGHVLEFNVGSPWPSSPNPMFLADLSGNVNLKPRDIWYFKQNSEGSWKIFSAQNDLALDSAPDDTPILTPASSSSLQNFVLEQEKNSAYAIRQASRKDWLVTLSIYQKGRVVRYAYGSPGYNCWFLLAATITSTVVATEYHTVTSTNAAETSTVNGGTVTSTATIIETITQTCAALAQRDLVGNALAKRWLQASTVVTSTVSIDTTTYVDGPVAFVTLPADVVTKSTTSYVTVIETTEPGNAAARPTTGGDSTQRVPTAPTGQVTIFATVTLTPGARSGAERTRAWSLLFLMFCVITVVLGL